MNLGELKNAQRRALNILDEWNNNVGLVVVGSGYYYELQGVVEDAVKCGAQAACGIFEKLDSED